MLQGKQVLYNILRFCSCFFDFGSVRLVLSRSIRRTSVASNAIQTIDNETAYLIIYCVNYIRHDGNSTLALGHRFAANCRVRFVYVCM